jgi:phytoene dehydrogenase-like protein
MMRMSKTLPGLDNFHMAGQWVEPGGSLPVTAMSGRNVRQVICKQDKKEFVASTP